MSYDRIWLCPSLKRTDWVEVRSKSRRLISNDQIFSEKMIKREYQRYGEKFKVSLSTGGHYVIDELYCFLNREDALRFFAGAPLDPTEHGYRDRECIEEDVGVGFDHVELYIHGELADRR